MDKSRILIGGHGGDRGTNPSNTMKSKKKSAGGFTSETWSGP